MEGETQGVSTTQEFQDAITLLKTDGMATVSGIGGSVLSVLVLVFLFSIAKRGMRG